jgi:hypothetical protein
VRIDKIREKLGKINGGYEQKISEEIEKQGLENERGVGGIKLTRNSSSGRGGGGINRQLSTLA